MAPSGASHERYRTIASGVKLSCGVAGSGCSRPSRSAGQRAAGGPATHARERDVGPEATPLRLARRSRSRAPRSPAPARARAPRCDRGSPPRARAAAAGAATAARPPTARRRARRTAASAAASASISPTGRLPRKHSVRCSDCASSSRSAPRELPGRPRARRHAARPLGELLAHRQGRVDGHEQPGCGTAGHRRQAMLAPARALVRRAGGAGACERSGVAQRAAQEVHRDGGRPLAHVGPAPGQVDRARQAELRSVARRA